jgi:hypothetical protein
MTSQTKKFLVTLAAIKVAVVIAFFAPRRVP